MVAQTVALEVMDARFNGLEELCAGFGGGWGNGNQLYYGDAVRQPGTLAYNSPATLLTLDWVLLSEAYKGQGIVQTIIDQPVEDAFRGGFDIICDELDDEEKTELLLGIGCTPDTDKIGELPVSPMESTLAISGVDMGMSDLQSLKAALKWARLYGGSGLIVNTAQDFRQPLDVDAISKDTPLQFIAADRWELILTLMQLYNPAIPCPFNYYGMPIHRTRVMRIMGINAPAFVRRQLQGWGLSEMERCLASINMYDRMESLVFDLLKEAKTDVFKIMGYNDQLGSDQGMAVIMRRLQLAMQGKSYGVGLTMDKEDDYIQKTLSFSGIPELWDNVRSNLCAAVRFPKNKLFGESATGFGGGEDALENYNGIVEITREHARPPLLEMLRIRSQQMFGFQPAMQVQFRPLKILNGVENEQVLTSKQARTMALRDADMVTGQEASKILKQDGLLPIDTEVLRGEREPEPMGQSAFNDDPQGIAVAGMASKPGTAKRGLAAADPKTRAAVSSKGGKSRA